METNGSRSDTKVVPYTDQGSLAFARDTADTSAKRAWGAKCSNSASSLFSLHSPQFIPSSCQDRRVQLDC